MSLINNSNCDWTGREYWFDNDGVAHKSRPIGDLIDDAGAIENGFYLEELDDE